mmetsp:Transcript_7837/g.7411  ORF Transcript_7837/g.7411 Transcript_7837/m.7411 type:complete len:226 (+) Transcript_7837:41-718(+)
MSSSESSSMFVSWSASPSSPSLVGSCSPFCSDFLSSFSFSFFLLSVTLLSLKKSSLACSSSSLSMKLIISSILGTTTNSKALTLLLVTLITSSRVMNWVWREAIWMRSFKKLAKRSLHLLIAFPPPVNPSMALSSLSSRSSPLRANLGRWTPAILSAVTESLMLLLVLTWSATFLPKSPAAKLASARESMDWLNSSPILFLVSMILSMTSLNAFLRASDFFLSSS